jgi:endonuclease YncB( thermonuclease family)
MSFSCGLVCSDASRDAGNILMVEFVFDSLDDRYGRMVRDVFQWEKPGTNAKLGLV